MSRKTIANSTHQTVGWSCGTFLLIGAGLAFYSSPAFAHAFDAGKSEYESFISGNQAVLEDLPVLIGLIAAGFFASIWKSDGWPSLWPFYILGIIVGVALGFAEIVSPAIPTYTVAIVVGLLGAAAPNFETNIMRALFALIGTVLTNAVLSGHTVDEIPPFAYAGIFFALNSVVAVSAGLVSVSIEKLPYSWVTIAWRAASSWLVAISVMALALKLNSAT